MKRKIIIFGCIIVICIVAVKIILNKKSPAENIPQAPLYAVSDEKIEIQIYFAAADGMYLAPEKRSIYRSKEIINQMKQAILELIKGPAGEGLIAPVPEGVQLREVYIDKSKTMYVDFSREISKNHKGGSTGEILTVYSIVNTVIKNFPEIRKVQILIEGGQVDTLAGHLDLSTPLSFKDDIIKTEEMDKENAR